MLALCITQGLLAVILSLRFRTPLSFAWSSPGAALLIAAHSTTEHFAAAVGAFVVAGVLTLLTGLWPALTRAVTGIPTPIAAAMLAGILFPICLSPVLASVRSPLLALPIIVVWLVLYRLAPRWAVPAALVVTIVVIGMSAGTSWLGAAVVAPRVVFVAPSFDPLVIVSLGIPLYFVTMAGQNVPGFAVLRTLDYPPPPARTVLVGVGGMSVVAGLFGGHAVNLAALSAALMAGPDAHPERSKRWIAAVTGGVVYLALGVCAGLATSLVSASPPLIIQTVAGLAMLGAFIAGLTSAFEAPQHRPVAAITFLVVVSGIAIAGIGSAFWGLVVGGVVMLWLETRRRRTA
ncbi:benzoate membrane transport protein [Galbitalea soli]|nr:benzoate membrane transport protein [Galbitalea soli]